MGVDDRITKRHEREPFGCARGFSDDAWQVLESPPPHGNWPQSYDPYSVRPTATQLRAIYRMNRQYSYSREEFIIRGGALTEIPSPRRVILSLKRGFSAVGLLHARRSSGRPPFGLDEISAISVSKISSSSAPVDFIARSAFKRV